MNIGNVCPASFWGGPHEPSNIRTGLASLDVCRHCGGAYYAVRSLHHKENALRSD